MFDSGITVQSVISQIHDEADISITIPNLSYVMWLNALEQLLYTELIREQGKIELYGEIGDRVSVSALNVPRGEATVRFEDIHAIYADETQLVKSTVASGVLFHNTFYKIQNDIGLNLKNQPEKLKIVYFVRPALKTEQSISTDTVMLPVEFIDIAKAKLRGEAYKLANEDSLAAKWINDYNVLLETFKTWLSGKQSEFGL